MLKEIFKTGVWFVVLNFVCNHIWTEPVWYWWFIASINLMIASIMARND